MAPVDPLPKPKSPPAALAVALPDVAQPTSEKSAALRQYLGQVQQAQLSQGLLRRESRSEDTPFTAHMLARNFEQIAFFSEYDHGFSGKGGPSPLRRWKEPVRMQIVFGDSVPPSQRKADTDTVNAYARRLARVTGHPISTTGTPNFLILMTSEDDREAALQKAVSRIPGLTEKSLRPMREMPRDTYCAVAAFAAGPDSNVYTAAVAVIRTENPELLRLACIHEELAQGLGLANDSPAARPSIFNDDDEFALLTEHDEKLLKMLYDPRLRPGMTAREAEPITRIIARELTDGPI